jgi:hypothetical protein
MFYQVTTEALFTAVDQGAVVLHMGTNYYYALNETGARIWALLDQLGDPAAVTSALVGEYDVPTTVAWTAVHAIVDRFTGLGLLVDVGRMTM